MSRYGPERKIATGKCCASTSFGLLEEENRRQSNARSDELFLAAQRRYELKLADKIEAEMCGGVPPAIRAEMVIIDELTPAERIETGLSPFERQDRALANGAGITETRPISRADPGYSLTGVSDIYGA